MVHQRLSRRDVPCDEDLCLQRSSIGLYGLLKRFGELTCLALVEAIQMDVSRPNQFTHGGDGGN